MVISSLKQRACGRSDTRLKSLIFISCWPQRGLICRCILGPGVNKTPSQSRESGTTIYGPFTPNGPVLSPNLWCLLGETFLWRVCIHHIVHVRRFELEPAVKKLLNVKEVLLVVISGQLVIGVLGQVILIGQKRPDTP